MEWIITVLPWRWFRVSCLHHSLNHEISFVFPWIKCRGGNKLCVLFLPNVTFYDSMNPQSQDPGRILMWKSFSYDRTTEFSETLKLQVYNLQTRGIIFFFFNWSIVDLHAVFQKHSKEIRYVCVCVCVCVCVYLHIYLFQILFPYRLL